MSFRTDKQTLEDLNIFSKPGKDSVFNIYNHTHTSGGSAILEKLFLFPLDHMDAINNRSLTIQYFSQIKMVFPIKPADLDSAEIYLAMTDPRTRLSSEQQKFGRKFSNLISADGDYKLIVQGIASILEIVEKLKVFLNNIRSAAQSTPYFDELQTIENLIGEERLTALLKNHNPGARLTYEEAVDFDGLIRFTILDQIKKILNYIYNLDVYMSIAKVAYARNYVFPIALDKNDHSIRLKQLYHPLVKNAKANDIEITPEKNVIFLTGANMAGKSTFMKSMGIAFYLAHIGLPVAAEKMEFSVRDGIYTTINLPDDLSSGNSHFYAEVLRVKKVAKELGDDKNLFVIFDELFRGTNVKDAYEGTIAITQAFAEKNNCMFVVSTHIIEAGAILGAQCPNINFVYLPTRMNGNIPVYTYKLETGITADRHGMIIINNERILEIIRSRKNKRLSK